MSWLSEKDIVTPAQSSLLKLLVSVYRPQPALPSPAHGEWGGQGPYPNAPFPFPFRSSLPLNAQHEYEEPPVIEASIPTFFVNVFRKQVLAPILSVIRLQGAIRRGEEPKERFELSLWDLDRIYEGVYQFMELFVLFSEDEDAKRVLHGNNDVLICDFVKLLGELDRQIPRYVASKDKGLAHRDKHEQTYQEQQTVGTETTVADRVHKPAVESKFMVERPFDIDDTGDTEGDLGFDDADDDADPDRDLVDPDEFTWPNVKRFLVILISSLAWHNSNVQDIVRKNGGVEVVLNQCKIDDDNPCKLTPEERLGGNMPGGAGGIFFFFFLLMMLTGQNRHPGTCHSLHQVVTTREPSEPENCRRTECTRNCAERGAG